MSVGLPGLSMFFDCQLNGIFHGPVDGGLGLIAKDLDNVVDEPDLIVGEAGEGTGELDGARGLLRGGVHFVRDAQAMEQLGVCRLITFGLLDSALLVLDPFTVAGLDF